MGIPARGLGCPGDTSGALPVRSEVFERRLPPGPVAILVLTGLAVYAENLPLFGFGMKRTFCLDGVRIYVRLDGVKGVVRHEAISLLEFRPNQGGY